MQLIHIKLKQARQKLKMTQKEVAEWMHWPSHNNVSNYEAGKQKGVPPEYIDFLLNHNFDLNSLFDNSVQEIQFKNEMPSTPAMEEMQRLCAEKDEEIRLLKAQIEILQETIMKVNEAVQTKRRSA